MFILLRAGTYILYILLKATCQSFIHLFSVCLFNITITANFLD